ncbi:hypothetical protein ACFLRY_01690 [Bacteroidota bacterium]
MKNKSSLDEIKGIDKNFYFNFEYLLNNYENMKDQISDELLDKFGEPVKEMIAGLVDQLKEELGEEELIKMQSEEYEEIEEEPILNIEEDIQPTSFDEINESIKKIDEKLSKGGLSEEEINKLLDQRMKLKQRKELN